MQRGDPYTSPTFEESLLLVAVTLAILAAPLLPRDLMDNGPSLCIFHALGIEGLFETFGVHDGCPGCGMSRAIWAILHGDLNRAVAYNWRVIIVAPILALLHLNFAASVTGRFLGGRRGMQHGECPGRFLPIISIT